MARLLKADGTEAVVKPTGEKFSLKELQNLVGGLIEIVHARGQLLIVDEEGLLKQKPYNSAASRFSGIHIVGDAVICESGEVD